MVPRLTKEYQVGGAVELVCDALGDHPLSTVWNRKKSGEVDWTQLSTEDSRSVDHLLSVQYKICVLFSIVCKVEHGQATVPATNYKEKLGHHKILKLMKFMTEKQ